MWSVFGKYIVENIKTNTLKETNKTTVPFHSKDGDIEYLGATYKEYVIDIEKRDDDKYDAETTEIQY